mmetsp:Transcript_68780/g.206283  ORF Transcript_68780/g.206283 Transcript_68780/m.206283 type:complete len:274 (-) Transcript_68780:181-1002(-)
MGAARRQDRTRRRQGPALPARAAPAHRPLRPQAGQRAHLRRPRGQALGRGRRQALRQHAHARAEPHAALRVARAAQRCGRGPASGRLLVRRHDPRGVPRPATTAARAAAVCAQKGVGRHAAAQTDRRSIGYGGALPRAGATADGGGCEAASTLAALAALAASSDSFAAFAPFSFSGSGSVPFRRASAILTKALPFIWTPSRTRSLSLSRPASRAARMTSSASVVLASSPIACSALAFRWYPLTNSGLSSMHFSASSSALLTLLSLRKACERFE